MFTRAGRLDLRLGARLLRVLLEQKLLLKVEAAVEHALSLDRDRRSAAPPGRSVASRFSRNRFGYSRFSRPLSSRRSRRRAASFTARPRLPPRGRISLEPGR